VALYPADGQPRALWIAPHGTTPPEGAELPVDTWLWGEVRSGVAMLTAPIAEAFVPQMLNYESVGGVNFKKGCYPGQEVVARSQFRGTLKRRAYVVHGSAPMQAGQEVFHESDPTQPCGLVAQAAPAPQGGWEAIVSMQVSAAEAGRLTVATAESAPLERMPLPYPLLADI
jgi:folate-binding protein YgfZ